MLENKRTIADLMMKQALPLDVKIALTRERIRQWINEFDEDGVYVSFSGGKDSTVLLHLVREVCGYKNVKAMFVDVPTQYPELKAFVNTFENVDIEKTDTDFISVCKEYGFPLISKEVSESVYGARKYLTSIIEESSIPYRQTDRQYSYYYRKVTGQGEYSKFSKSLSSIDNRANADFTRGGVR